MILGSYNSLDNLYGSDHRPVQLDIYIDLKPVRFLQLSQLMNPSLSQYQATGVFTFHKLKLKGFKPQSIENITKKRLVYPSHL